VTLLLGMLFGAVGSVYVAIARRQHEPSYLVCGVLLLIVPWFVTNAFLIVVVGVTIAAFPIARAKGWI
jgi:hypothetical protein